jgi:hypothetical protein
VPTKNELNVLFNNCAAIGGFDRIVSFPDGWYWSSSRGVNPTWVAWSQRFGDGAQNGNLTHDRLSVRLVR